MKKILVPFLIMSIVYSACKKDSQPTLPPNHNEVTATVVLSSGNIININANGSKALMGLRGFLGGPDYIEGTNAANAAVYIKTFKGDFVAH